MKGVTILGATGSVGTQTLEVISHHPDRFQVIALTAHQNLEGLVAQCQQWKPRYAVITDERLFERFRSELSNCSPHTKALSGEEGLKVVASLSEIEIVVAAIVGAAGLTPTLAAVHARKRILLANKETLVMAGSLFMQAVHHYAIELLPIDSEHNAIFQCLALHRSDIARLILTASGGATYSLSLDELPHITPEKACQHPNWSMGKKISIDSATMMNKGFELIEAHYLFETAPEKIDIVIHPQSIVHSLVEYGDGSVLAHLANPDMRLPIMYGLAWPERLPSGVKSLNLLQYNTLEFKAVELKRYPCLELARHAIQAGGTAPAILNAVNEVAVRAFLEGHIRLTDIFHFNQELLEKSIPRPLDSLETVWQADREARERATKKLSFLISSNNNVSINN